MEQPSQGIGQNISGNSNIFSGTGPVIVVNNPVPPVDAQTQRDLSILLNKVKTFWIEQVLEKSSHSITLLELNKKVSIEFVDHPWSAVLELPDATRQMLPSDTTIGELFNQYNRALLILGEPGSGKTITLLELARDLISRFEADKEFRQPVPIILNLSSWADKQQPIIEWIITELGEKYQVPKRLSRFWLESNYLLPLLDGLDEVRVEVQVACVEAINMYAKEFGVSGLVVCSRIQEYLQMSVRLGLYAAICLQPLTTDQVDSYLAALGIKLETLRMILPKDDALRELAQSPLMLSVMSLAYQDFSPEMLIDSQLDSPESRQSHLFDTYIQKMFKRRGGDSSYTQELTVKWLSWLALKMSRHDQSVFLIERMQPSWLSAFWQRLLHSISVMLIIVVPVGLLVGIGSGYPIINFDAGRVFGVGSGITAGLAVWLAARRIFNLISSLFVGSVLGITFGVAFGLTFGQSVGLLIGITISIATALVFGLVGRRLLGGAVAKSSDIDVVELLNWSWLKALPGLTIGFIAGFVFGWVIEQTISDPSQNLYFGQAFGLATGLVSGLVSGLTANQIDVRTTPNQGIWQSARNAIRIGIAISFAVGIPIGIACGNAASTFYQLSESLKIGIVTGGTIGLAFGIAVGVLFGGLAFIQHFVLRLLLYFDGHMLWNYARFLDYCSERIFLRNVGGGYIFIHRLLLEHFAKLNGNIELD